MFHVDDEDVVRNSNNGSRDSSPMELPKLLQRGASFKFGPSAARFHASHPTRSGCLSKLWAAFLLVFLTLLSLYIFKGHRRHPALQASSSQQLQGYGVAIGIGRVEARVHVLQFEGREIRVLGRENSLAPYNVPVVVGNLLEFAKGLVPEAERENTRVYVVGTGGLEWVVEHNRAAFLEECRKAVKQSEFEFREEWAMVLNGRDEGVYEWVAANYAPRAVENDATNTIGVLNLGDESAQVTFDSEEAPPFAYFHKIALWGITHNLYSYSFDKVGLETASKSLMKLLHARAVASSTSNTGNKFVLDPCAPHGFRGPNHFGTQVAGDAGTTVETFPTIPAGNFSACRTESLALLQQGQEACHDKDCPAGTIFVPELRGNYIATGKFHETAKYFKLLDMASLADLIAAGENYCGGEVADVALDAFPEYEVVRKPCFSAAFVVAFLHDSLGLPVNSSNVKFTDSVDSVPVSWPVGFLLTQLLQQPTPNVSSSSSPLLVLGALFATNGVLLVGVAVLVGLLGWLVLRWRRPQLKTIYDLEKGKYFTTAARGR